MFFGRGIPLLHLSLCLLACLLSVNSLQICPFAFVGVGVELELVAFPPPHEQATRKEEASFGWHDTFSWILYVLLLSKSTPTIPEAAQCIPQLLRPACLGCFWLLFGLCDAMKRTIDKTSKGTLEAIASRVYSDPCKTWRGENTK